MPPLFPFSEFIVPEDECRYSTQDGFVWRSALKAQHAMVQKFTQWVEPAYIHGLEALQLRLSKIPSASELNVALRPSGWSVLMVDGYIPSKLYFKLVGDQVFPVARNLRSLHQLEHSPTPDFIHDVLGHLPMLFCVEYVAYLRRISAMILAAIPESSPLDEEIFALNRRISLSMAGGGPAPDGTPHFESRLEDLLRIRAANESLLSRLENLFLWSIEFGLLGLEGGYRIFGAGLLSSRAEIESLVRGRTPLLDHSLDAAKHQICFTGQQPHLFLAKDYKKLLEVLDQAWPAFQDDPD